MSQPIDDAEYAAWLDQYLVFHERTRRIWRHAAGSVHPDVQPIGYRVLSYLVRKGPSTPGRLSEELDLDRSVVSRQGRQLADLGFLEISSSESDGRCKVFVPTQSARDVVATARAMSGARMREQLGELSHEELAAFTEMLTRLNDAGARLLDPGP
ncbi:MarR family winged helix-turn-helix transcriptional regulator [Serinibacter salmoneus]|uniref:MarR family transcriptional regulator n=1 Tax=Serinibacter salmoneus TaxID=556530 RepID=A0A2A9D2W2_9MICO|nr:MarR family winged helix-turn-helix transcriptional regulator [Serinibacter salmoneus]PFG21048.1 MarR family transcriptional regulator [Serinibacter salmoneus]